jgi:Tfp pilus assembly PilM family ATPase
LAKKLSATQFFSRKMNNIHFAKLKISVLFYNNHNMFPFKKRITAVDFGTKYIKMVELEKSGRNFNLLNYSITSLLLEDSFKYPLGITQLFEENLATILRRGSQDFKTKNVIFVLPSSYLFSTLLSLPHMPKKSLPTAIKYEAKKYLSVNSPELSIQSKTFQLKSPYEQNKTRISVFLVGIPNGLITKLKTVAMLAGLHYKKSEPEFFAYEPFFVSNNSEAVLINVDTNYSLLSLFHKNEFVFGKKLRFRLFNLIENVSKLLGIAVSQAEDFLIEKKFKIPEELKLIQEALDDYFTPGFNEIQDEINGIQEKFGFKVENLFLAGSATDMPGFIEVFQKYAGNLKINSLDSFSSLGNVPNKNTILSKGPVFAGAVGACLKYFGR